MPNDVAVAEEAPTGVAKVLSLLQLNILELIVLVVFWVGAAITSSMVGVETVMSALSSSLRIFRMRSLARASSSDQTPPH